MPTLEPVWIIQGNLDNQRRIQDLTEALTEQSITYHLVKAIPFQDILEDVPKLPSDTPVICNGSTKLIRLAQEVYHWKPGVWYNPATFRYEEWQKRWGNRLLNAKGFVTTYNSFDAKEYIDSEGEAFIRPCQDLKSFTGTIVESETFREWQSQQHNVPDDLPVVISPVQTISAEYRLFIVDNQIISGSRYRYMGQLSPSSFVDPDAAAFAKECLGEWKPGFTFVMDVADTAHGYKIVEINCLNGSGFYHADVRKIVTACQDAARDNDEFGIAQLLIDAGIPSDAKYLNQSTQALMQKLGGPNKTGTIFDGF